MLSSPRPTWQPAPFRRPPISKVRPASRGSIDCLNARPRFIRGAQDIISIIISRRTVTKLILNHIALGDDGCVVLFKFLCSDAGRSTNISEINLAQNGIGDRGLIAISEYLSGNKTLKELYLQSNLFQGAPSVVSVFIAAINSSHLERLSLCSNKQLSDSFLATFLPSLTTPHLRELSLSLVGLTFHSVTDITSFISSSRCRLHNLSLNGNELGLSGVTDLIRTIKDCNLGLQKVELYSNQVGPPGQAEAWKNNVSELKKLLIRNQHLKKQNEKDALVLLVAARASLLPSKCRRDAQIHLLSCSLIHPEPFLPTELQLYILSFLAPHLSSAQRIRIYTYASTPDTLPALLPRLSSNNNDKSHSGPPRSSIPSRSSKTGCLDGCIRGVVCQKERERERWLKVVGCDTYERYEGRD